MASQKKIIAQHAKRISLRCPCAVIQSFLEKDKADNIYSLRLTLQNTGDSSLENDTVESASLVMRCIDSDGEYLTFGDSDYTVKTVNFGEYGLARAQEISMTVVLGEISELTLVNFEIYISRIRFADGAVLDYLRTDFFPLPAKPILLSKELNSAELEKAREALGESAEYLPEHLSSSVWRCTCSEITEDQSCPMCGLEKNFLFDYFGIPDDMIYIPKSERKYSSEGKQERKKLALLALLICVVVLLAGLLVFAIVSKANDRPTPPDESTNTTTTEKPDTPIVGTFEELAKTYANSGNFDQAFAVVTLHNLSDEFKKELLYMAVNYYKEGDEGKNRAPDFVKAYEYSQLIEGYEGSEILLKGAYDQCMSSEKYDSALTYADLLQNAALREEAITKALEIYLASGDYITAYDTAAKYEESERASSIAAEGIQKYREQFMFDNAITLAEKSNQPELVKTVNKEAAVYYIDKSDFDGAAKYAAAVGDPEVMEYLCEKLDDSTVKMSLPSYFKYLPAERKRTVLANTVSAGRMPSLVTPDGKVLYGAGLAYTPENGAAAISVSSGELHTLILLDNGQVVALGDNSYGQCDLPEITNAVAISAGANHSIILLDDGTLIAAGDNRYGQCNVSAFENIVQISAGYSHTLALTQEGKALAAGNNSHGQCNVSGFENVVYLSAGRLHSLALTSKGTALSAGSNLLAMSAVSSWSNLVSLNAGQGFSIGMLQNGELVITGSLITGSAGNLSLLTGCTAFDAGEGYIIAFMNDGSVVSTGALSPNVSWMNEILSTSPETPDDGEDNTETPEDGEDNTENPEDGEGNTENPEDTQQTN